MMQAEMLASSASMKSTLPVCVAMAQAHHMVRAVFKPPCHACLPQVGLPVASCLLVRAPIGSEKPDGSRAFVLRPYTPISHPDEKGHFELAIKVYPDGK